jgi:hypothetical protein
MGSNLFREFIDMPSKKVTMTMSSIQVEFVSPKEKTKRPTLNIGTPCALFNTNCKMVAKTNEGKIK